MLALKLGLSLVSSNKGGGETFFLDEYSGAAVAYSLRKLSSSITNVIRVRESGANAEQDFTSSEITDGTLTTFTGSNDGFVTTWYDQSGNSRDASNTTAANQPKIVSSGSLILSDLSKPTVQYDASNDLLSLASDVTLTSDKSILFVAQADSTQVYSDILGDTDTSTQHILIYGSKVRYKPGTGVNVSGTGENRGSNKLWSLIVDSSNELFIKRNATSYGTSTDGAVANDFIFSCIGSNLTVNNPDNITEVIIYQTDKSSQLSDMETNINDFYSIY